MLWRAPARVLTFANQTNVICSGTPAKVLTEFLCQLKKSHHGIPKRKANVATGWPQAPVNPKDEEELKNWVEWIQRGECFPDRRSPAAELARGMRLWQRPAGSCVPESPSPKSGT